MKMENQFSEKIIEFFGKDISDEEFAQTTRRFVAETIRIVLETNVDYFNKEWISNGYYWLNEFCEMLDPQLEKDIQHKIKDHTITQHTN